MANFFVGVSGQNPGQIVEQLGLIWVEFQGGAVVTNGVVCPAKGRKRVGDVSMGKWMRRTFAQGPGKMFDGVGGMAEVQLCDSHVEVNIRIPRVGAKGVCVMVGRLLPLPL